MSSHKMVLLIEDDVQLKSLVKKEIQELGLDVDEAGDGKTGLEKAISGNYDLLVLDLNLPQLDGLEVCKRLRAANSAVPILMLTARKDELDRVLGLELGADDYLTKPFSMRELLARVKAILRRTERAMEIVKSAKEDPDSAFLRIGGLEIDLSMRRIHRDGQMIPLSSMEFDLVAFLASNPGKAFTREELLEHVWGYSAVGYEQNVTTHMNRIRRKLEADVENPVYLKTVRGFGYAFAQVADFAKS